MTAENDTDRDGIWARVDASAFGMIYGSVTVLALLMAMAAHPDGPLASAVVLFGSVLAISMAKAFADLMSTAIDTGERITRAALSRAWHHARDTMVAANLPTLTLSPRRLICGLSASRSPCPRSIAPCF